MLLNNYKFNPYDDICKLTYAVRCGLTYHVKSILSNSDIKKIGSNIFYEACIHGYKDIVEILLNDSRVNVWCGSIIYPCMEGNIDIVKILLRDNRINPHENNQMAITFASQRGYKEIVQLLLSDDRCKITVDA